MSELLDIVTGKKIPDGYQLVKYGTVDGDMFIWADGGYRKPFDGELGRSLRQFLSVIRKSR